MCHFLCSGVYSQLELTDPTDPTTGTDQRAEGGSTPRGTPQNSGVEKSHEAATVVTPCECILLSMSVIVSRYHLAVQRYSALAVAL